MQSKFNVIIACLKQQFSQSFGRSMFRFCIFGQPIIYGLILGMMYLNRSGEEFLIYVLFGSGIVSFWSSICFSSASDINRERFMGTLESIFVAPAGFKNIIIGKIIGNTFWGLVSMIISSTFVLIVFRKPFTIDSPLLLATAFLLMTLSFIAIALFMAGLFTLSRNTRLVMNSLEHPIFLLCGIVFPVEILPRFIQPISYLLSPTWAIKLLRLSVIGGHTKEKFFYLVGLSILTLLYWFLGHLLFKKIDYKARVKATLGVY
ncbi:MAG: ABC transporter permease [Clostridiales bacterium]|nr:ABC transporter permease [Clostridiales bacterium]